MNEQIDLCLWPRWLTAKFVKYYWSPLQKDGDEWLLLKSTSFHPAMLNSANNGVLPITETELAWSYLECSIIVSDMKIEKLARFVLSHFCGI